MKFLSLVACVALSGLALGVDAGKPDFFDIIGKTPADVAASLTRPSPGDEIEALVAGFVGLPMSAEHRREFMGSLQATIDGAAETKIFAVHCLLNLLEEEGRLDDALALVRSQVPQSDYDRIREVGLLWKAGKIVEAAALADQIPKNPGRNDSVWLSLAKIDLIGNRPTEAMRTLGFLENLPGFPAPLRHSLALQQLEIARPSGQVDALIMESASPVLRAVWSWNLDRREQAHEDLRAAGTINARDVWLLIQAMGAEPHVRELAALALARNETILAERRDLLFDFLDTRHRFTLWSGMAAGHGDTVDLLLPDEKSLSATDRAGFRKNCLEILATHPENPQLRLLTALLSVDEPDRGRALFLEAARAVREISPAEPLAPDPARTALEKLVPLVPAGELETALSGTPGFDSLPVSDRLRYLMAADLGIHVSKTLATLKPGEVWQEDLASAVIAYFEKQGTKHVIPPDVITTLLDRSPEMVIGSPAKYSGSPTERTRAWFRFLDRQVVSAEFQTDAANRLAAAAGKNPEFQRAVLAGIPEKVWALPGLTFARPEQLPARTLTAAPEFLVLSGFTPPASQNYFWKPGHQPMHWTHMTARRNGHDLLLEHSPWSVNLRGIRNPQRFDPVVQAKLRRLFEGAPSRTILYDLLVATGAVECPDLEVKATAERRMAELPSAPQEDPMVAAYLFYVRVAGGEALDKCLPLLAGMKNFPRPARIRIRRAVNAMRNSHHTGPPHGEALSLIEHHLNLTEPAAPPPVAEPPKPPEPLSDYDRLKFFEVAGKLDSPECVALARDVLFRFIDSERKMTKPTENVAVGTLVVTGNFQKFLDDLKSRLSAADKSELEVQRAFYRVHLYKSVHSKGEIAPFAKRVLELDPADMDAAYEVLAAAIQEQDRPLVLKALECFARGSRTLLMQALGNFPREPGRKPTDPLHLFAGPAARELAAGLMRVPLAEADPSRSDGSFSFTPLYLHFARHDLESLKPVLRWTGDFSLFRSNQLVPIVEELVRNNQAREAVALLAEVYFTPVDPAAEDGVRFVPKKHRMIPDNLTWSIQRLAQAGILKSLAEAATAFPASPATAEVRLMIELSADPTPDAWNRLVPPFLAAQPMDQRGNLRGSLKKLVGTGPDSAELRRQLATEDDVLFTDLHSLDAVARKLESAFERADPSSASMLWETSKPFFARAREYDRRAFLLRVTVPLAKLAADDVWREFLDQIRTIPDYGDHWTRDYARAPRITTLPPHRLQELMAQLLPGLKPDKENSGVLRIFNLLSASETADTALLENFRPWIDLEIASRSDGLRASPRLQFLDLLAGNPAAASPQLAATADGESSCRIDWSLAGYKGSPDGFPFARKFPFLDSKFDLEILAGPLPERMDRAATVPAVPGTGRLSMKVPPGSRFVSLVARQRDGTVVRSSNPVRLESANSQPVQFLLGPINRIPASGPFFHEVSVEIPSAATTVDLAEIPWTVGTAPSVSGWLLDQGGSGHLTLSFRTANGVEIEAHRFESSSHELDGMALWQPLKTPANREPPAGTEKVVLVFRSSDEVANRSIRLSEVRFIPGKMADLPAGLTRIGRIPTRVDWITLDTMSNRFATASNQGVGVFDFTTGQFSGWIPLGSPKANASQEIRWLALAGDRLVCAAASGDVYLIFLSKRTAQIICRIEGFEFNSQVENDFAFSSDGGFLARTAGMAGLHLMKISDDGTTSERLLETSRISSIAFDPQKNTLEAWDGANDLTLPLAEWEKAPLQIARNDRRPAPEDPARKLNYRVHDQVIDPRTKIKFHTGLRAMPGALEIKNRVVALPPGLVGLDREGVPFHITPFGEILRVDVAKVPGYQPLDK